MFDGSLRPDNLMQVFRYRLVLRHSTTARLEYLEQFIVKALHKAAQIAHHLELLITGWLLGTFYRWLNRIFKHNVWVLLKDIHHLEKGPRRPLPHVHRDGRVEVGREVKEGRDQLHEHLHAATISMIAKCTHVSKSSHDMHVHLHSSDRTFNERIKRTLSTIFTHRT
jgi:hypothetical protein